MKWGREETPGIGRGKRKRESKRKEERNTDSQENTVKRNVRKKRKGNSGQNTGEGK